MKQFEVWGKIRVSKGLENYISPPTTSSIKGTVNVILSESLFIEWHVRFTNNVEDTIVFLVTRKIFISVSFHIPSYKEEMHTLLRREIVNEKKQEH